MTLAPNPSSAPSPGRAPARDWLRFDRADRIVTAMWLWLTVGVTAALPLFLAVGWFLRGEVTLTGVPVDLAEEAVGAGRVVGRAEADVLLGDVGAPNFLLILLPMVLVVAATIWGAVLLSHFLDDLGRGEPFVRANVTRMRIIGLLLIVVPLVGDVLYGIARTVALEAAGADAATVFSVNITPAWVVAGLLVAAVAEAFASGIRLREDLDGLV